MVPIGGQAGAQGEGGGRGDQPHAPPLIVTLNLDALQPQPAPVVCHADARLGPVAIVLAPLPVGNIQRIGSLPRLRVPHTQLLAVLVTLWGS